ncbi:MAG: LysR family transcriptional regulator [Acidimicrobiales bacterium]
MELRRLRYFVAVAEELHFGRAAERLHLAQPALSQQIRVLEHELGGRLFERNSRRVALTEAGAALLDGAPQLLRAAEELDARVRAVAAGGAGRLRVHTTRSAPMGITAVLIDRFRAESPGVHLELVTGFTGWNLEELAAGRSDVVFVRPPVDVATPIEVVPLGEEELVVALPAGQPLADRTRRRRIRPEDLEGQDVVSWPRRNAPGMHDRIEAQVWGGRSPRVAREEPDDEQVLRAVAAGAGLAGLIGTRLASLRVPGVVVRRFAEPAPTVGLALAWRPDGALPAAARFVDLARRLASVATAS